MSQKRTMSGNADLSGETLGTLRIGAMVSRRPLPRYETTCERCGAQSFAGQRELVQGTAFCRNSACGKDAIYESLAETPARFARKQQAREQEKLDAIAAEVQAKANAIARIQRDQIAKGYDDDWDLRRIDPSCAEVSMTPSQADAFNAEQYRLFHAETPGWYASRSNIDTMQGYLSRNGCSSIVSKAMLAAAFSRLDAYGLLEHRPAPEPARQTPTQATMSERAPQPAKRREPEVYEGVDLETGKPRTYSKWDVDRMTGDEMKKKLRLTPSKLALPTHASF